MKLKILLIDFMDVLTPGGINTTIREIAKHLAEKGHEVHVFTQSAGRENVTLDYGNLTIIKGRKYIGLPYGFNFLNLILLLRTINEIKPHIIHIHGYQNPFPLIAVLLIKVLYRNIPLVLSPHFSIFGHSTFIGRHFFRLYNITLGKKLINAANVLILSSLFELKTLINEIRKVKPRMYYIPHGVSYHGNECSNSSNVNELPRGSDGAVMIYVGYLYKYKGVQDAIKALAKLIYDYNRKTKLVVVGDGPYKRELMKLASDLRVDKYIEWVGFQRRQLIQHLCNADILVFMSEGEMFGLVAYEALKLGLPVIAKRKGALIECTRHNCCLGASTYEEAAQLVLTVIDDISKGYLKYSCKESAKAIPSWEQVASRYEHLYIRTLTME